MVAELQWLRAGEITKIGEFGFRECPRVGERVSFTEDRAKTFHKGLVLEVEHDQWRGKVIVTMAQGLPSRSPSEDSTT